MSLPRLVSIALLGVIACACGSSDDGASPAAAGGANGAGGASDQGGSGTKGSGGKSMTTMSVSCSSEAAHTGQATYYTGADGSGNCSFDKSPDALDIGAMNATDYAGSAACGACVTIHGPKGDLSIRIVDQCPDCPTGNIDLSPSAFDKIADHVLGRVPITWEYAACAETGPLSYFFKEGSNPYWTAVEVRHHRNRIAKFEVQKNGAFVDVNRETYNYFVDPSGMGAGPYTFRVTDVYGGVVTDTGIALKESTEVPGKSQLPECK